MQTEATVGVVEGGGPARKLVQGMHSDASTLRKASIWLEATRIVNEAKAWSNSKSFYIEKAFIVESFNRASPKFLTDYYLLQLAKLESLAS
ncbi:unnamed protein product [Lactuca virosa]|uniref:Uncharacterized protein n=1 Tax=Lactuca virosa TaxID=75947 RepID=A0AAU9LXG8_9ASTR|nr:unnamed protein product [Lactuca virosa]